MKSSRHLVQRINIRDDVNSRTMRRQQNISVNTKNSRVVQNAEIIQNKSHITQNKSHVSIKSQAKQFQNIIEQNIPATARKKTEPNVFKMTESQTFQQEKIQSLNHHLSQLSVSVSNIKNQYSQLKLSQSKLLNNSIKKTKKIGKLDDPKISQFLFKKQQEQQQREKKRLEQIQMIQKKRQEKQELQQKQKQQNKQQKKQQIKKGSFIKERISNQKLQQSQKQKHAQQIFKKYRDSVPLFEIKQKQNLENQVKRIQFVKQYLKQHKDNYSSNHNDFKDKKLEEHSKWYDQQIQKRMKQKNQQKIQVFNKIQQQNQRFRDLYRGKATQNALNQLKQMQQKKQIPYRIRQKMKDYEGFVKQNFKPKPGKNKIIDLRGNSSSLDLKTKRQTQSTLSFRQIKRYKYIHGVSYGQVSEQRPLAKSFQQKKRAGLSYLEYMKSLPKKKVQTNIEIQIPNSRPLKQNPLQHFRKRRPIVHLNSEPTRDQIHMVLEQLRLNDTKINKKQRMAIMKGAYNQETDQDRNQINQQILLNVQKKLNLLHQLQDNSVKLKTG